MMSSLQTAHVLQLTRETETFAVAVFVGTVFSKRSCKALRVRFTESSLLACSTSFLPREESPRNSGVGSAGPVLLKNMRRDTITQIRQFVRSQSSCRAAPFRACACGRCAWAVRITSCLLLARIYIWRSSLDSPNRQIKLLDKFSCYTVCTYTL